MKKCLCVLLCLLCVFALASCVDAREEEESNHTYVIGRVIEVYEGRCCLEITDGADLGFGEGELVIVNTSIDRCPDYEVGDFLKVEFDGTVALSYPPQILSVLAIRKTDGNGKILE